jgi:hypothetical protein
MLYTKEVEAKFEIMMTKIKKGNLAKEERLTPTLT